MVRRLSGWAVGQLDTAQTDHVDIAAGAGPRTWTLQSAECRVQRAACRVQSAECRVQRGSVGHHSANIPCGSVGRWGTANKHLPQGIFVGTGSAESMKIE